MSNINVAHPIIILHGGGVAAACGLDGQMLAGQLHGLFAGDTRVLSTYRLAISGHPWRLLGRVRSGHGTAQWEFTNPPLRDPGGDIPAGHLLLSLRRRIDGALHDDLRLAAFVPRRIRVRLTLHMDSDFADIFEVRQRSMPPRLRVRRDPKLCGGVLAYERGGFRRALHFRCDASGGEPLYTSSLLVYELDLQPNDRWTCCVEAVPEVGDRFLPLSGDPHGPEPRPVQADGMSLRGPAILERPFARAQADLRSLAMSGGADPPYVAAGVPWYLALFGRDTLMVALMAALEGSWTARGALVALGRLQATERDDWRDAEPGKIPHEIRHGELAERGAIPHKAYYGTHDAPALYCLAVWQAWRWTGDRALLTAHFETARKALEWCERLGDRDGDGLLEYGTRSHQGYYNQGWKDSEDGILYEDGRKASLPLATVELQAYWYAAYLAMAELWEQQDGAGDAARCRAAARALRARVEERYWMEEEGTYALALDGDKRQVRSVASNAGHVLWCGLPSPARARRVAERFVQDDLFSGWGLRTLTSRHCAYNPLSYHIGSVWPHDTVLAAAGLLRYGARDQAATLCQAILEAAAVFEDDRLPELFCGMDRAHGLPVPYEEANVPQAWAAAATILIAQVLLGIVPDAPRARCYVSPWLPAWLPKLECRDVAIGNGTLRISITRRGEETVIDDVSGKDLEVLTGPVPAPLWGVPIEDR